MEVVSVTTVMSPVPSSRSVVVFACLIDALSAVPYFCFPKSKASKVWNLKKWSHLIGQQNVSVSGVTYCNSLPVGTVPHAFLEMIGFQCVIK